MRTTIGALALVALVALTGCATATPSAPETADSTAPTASVLDGEWRLVSATDAKGKVDLGTSITTITLTGEETGGQAPCNVYRATVEIGAGHDVVITPGATTKVACTDAALTAVETRYLAALALVIRTDVVENQLVLSNEDEKIALTYAAAPAVDETALVGINWQLESLLAGVGDEAVPTSATGGSILFTESDFEARGTCSVITGSWTVAGGLLLLTDVANDLSACGKPLPAGEKVLANTLSTRPTVIIDDVALTLSSATTKSGLQFRASNN
ncbi:META domain-containing protein [Glaciihabitans arcticus]|uniref:META domain-containing protein n=1 Tax=Glaciihabitans arcticus TaxID=2668039 RepID=A0A4Q9GRF5_9MICO|nr:META domain-containing protein [Glaciihabitans arcticus]TBN57231.1 META domain-containing protein [Glaciihabitans arcticus]